MSEIVRKSLTIELILTQAAISKACAIQSIEGRWPNIVGLVAQMITLERRLEGAEPIPDDEILGLEVTA